MIEEEIASNLHFGNKGMISAFETGKRDLSMGALIAYADYFKVSTDWILKGYPENVALAKNTGIVTDGKIQKIVDIYNQISDERIREVALMQLELLTTI